MAMATRFKALVCLLCILISFQLRAQEENDPKSALCDFGADVGFEQLTGISELQSMEIRIDNGRKWAKNILQVLRDRSDQRIRPENKKWFRGTLVSRYKFGKCSHRVKVKLSGDWKDHIRFKDGAPIASLTISLKTGNIFGAVKFKAYLPETRGGDDEIIATQLTRALGFLAPRTRNVKLSVNGISYEALLQERNVKEFLEFNKRREGPLFEGDETIFRDMDSIQPSSSRYLGTIRSTNVDFLKRTPNNAVNGLIAFGDLQSLYIKCRLQKQHFITEPKNVGIAKDLELFDLLMLSMNATSTLSLGERVWYFNSLAQLFEPIYYDGNPKFQKVSGDDIDKYHAESFSDESFELLDKKISEVDVELLRESLLESNAKFSVGDINQKLQMHREKLLDLKNIFQANKKGLPVHGNDPNGIFSQEVNSTYSDALFSTLDLDDLTKQLELCRNARCANLIMEKLSELLEVTTGNFTRKRGNVSYLFPLNAPRLKVFEFQGFRVSTFGERSNPPIFRGNVLYLDGVSGSARYLMTGYIPEGLMVEYRLSKVPENPELDLIGHSDFFGRTGCVTIYDSEFKNLEFRSNGTQCEDALNVVSSRGSFRYLSIKKSAWDAFDADFSHLQLSGVEIHETGNDCIDLSGGTYEVSAAALFDCGDKAVSVGEQSLALISDVVVKEASYGIASKDSSDVQVENVQLYEIKTTCFGSYQKKQEYWNGRISTSDTSCTK